MGDGPPRRVIGFVIAPLLVPAVLTPLFFTTVFQAEPTWAFAAAITSAAFAYLGMLGLGLPAFIFFIARGWTHISIALLTGFVCGAVAWLAFCIAFGLWLGESFRLIISTTVAAMNYPEILWLAGPGLLGAAVGAIFWAIMRPDRMPM